MVLIRVYKAGIARNDVASKVAECKQNVFRGLKQNDIFSLNANVPDECSCVAFFKPKTSFFVSTFFACYFICVLVQPSNVFGLLLLAQLGFTRLVCFFPNEFDGEDEQRRGPGRLQVGH
jgi:hypothetical protein